MKKIILLMLLCVCFIFTGCSYGEAGLVRNADGTVNEYYYIPFPEIELLNAGVTSVELNSILANIRADYEAGNGLIGQLVNDYKARILASDYSLEQKNNLIKGISYEFKLARDNDGYCIGIQYIFTFENINCYLEFKEANSYIKEDKEVIKINYFFTTVTKTVQDPIFDKISNGAITIGKNCLKQVEKHMGAVLGDRWLDVKYYTEYEKYASKFNYTYVVPTARLHSNANSITKQANGYYYHTWSVNGENLDQNGDSVIKIEYWTVSANRAVWYVFALLITGIVIASVYLKATKKEEIKEFKAD